MSDVTVKRVWTKGHYRVIVRDTKTGRIISSKKWSPRRKTVQKEKEEEAVEKAAEGEVAC